MKRVNTSKITISNINTGKEYELGMPFTADELRAAYKALGIEHQTSILEPNDEVAITRLECGVLWDIYFNYIEINAVFNCIDLLIDRSNRLQENHDHIDLPIFIAYRLLDDNADKSACLNILQQVEESKIHIISYDNIWDGVEEPYAKYAYDKFFYYTPENVQEFVNWYRLGIHECEIHGYVPFDYGYIDINEVDLNKYTTDDFVRKYAFIDQYYDF